MSSVRRAVAGRVDADSVRRAIAGGVAGTTVMLVVMLMGEAEAQFQLDISAAIARYVGLPTYPLLGLFIFLVVGIFVWPVVFLLADAPLRRLPGGSDPAIRGIAFSVPLWVLFVLLASPDLAGPLLALNLAVTLIAHLLYGYALGAVYHSLRPS